VPSDLGDHGANAKPREVTTLERRVLAHERILQTLISHLAENDPDIFEQLNTRFGAAYDLGAHEQDYVTTSHYCEYFLSNIQQQLSERHMANARQALASMSQCTGRAAVVLDEPAAEEQALLQEERIEGGGLAVSTTLRKTAYFQILRSDHIMLTSTQSAGGDWQWQLHASTGAVIAGGYGFRTRGECLGAVRFLKDRSGGAKILMG
jgi:uncharacterized protein YegP (UPF0339 family)